MTRALAAIALVLGVYAVSGCGGNLRTVPSGRHVDPRPVPVQDPPPAAKVERVPPDPGEPCAWLDGRWERRGRGWEWRSGAWVVAPAGCFFAPPFALWTTSTGSGVLYHYPGRWYPEDGRSRCAEPRPCVGSGALSPE